MKKAILPIVLALFLFAFKARAQSAFITSWKTTSAGESITIPVNPHLSGYNYTVDWGDGNSATGQTGDAIHTYTNAGTYTVSITGNFPAIQFSNIGGSSQIIAVEQWGSQVWQSMEYAFESCTALTHVSTVDVPKFAAGISLEGMFHIATSFNQNLSGWDVSNVQKMSRMFENATSFNGSLDGWNTGSVTDMSNMFNGATSFNQDLNGWNVSNVQDMSRMFENATSFNGSIDGWNTGSVTDMTNMFIYATAFNQDLNSWDVSNVQKMNAMFQNATSFNSGLNGWNTGSVTDMTNMFLDATAFNQDLSRWNVSNVQDFPGMFQGATSFNQNLGTWDMSSLVHAWSLSRMLSNSGLSTANYDATLTGWATQQNIPTGITLDAENLTYCAADSARQALITNHGWTINGDTKDPNCNTGGPPKITSNGGGNTATIDIAENTTMVTTVTATGNAGATLTYSTAGGADNSLFTINASTGKLTFNTAPDFDNPADANGDNRYEVTVQVSDGSKTDEQAITVSVTDVNKSPVITSNGGGSTASISINENSTAVTTVTATDADPGSTLTYSISGGADQTLFTINGTTGVLTFSTAPDFENPTDNNGDNNYDIAVQVSDGTNAVTQAITVTVTDVNEVPSTNAFITTWKTTTANESITIPTKPNQSGYNYTVNWGDGGSNGSIGSSASHTYASAGTYTVSITGDFPAIQFGAPNSNDDNDAKLLTIEQWGTQVWQGMEKAFTGCVNLTTESSTDAPILAPNSNFTQMFKGCTSFNSDLNDWDVSRVGRMSSMFFGASDFNGNISSWDVSNVTGMENMFRDATSFNGDISNWNVSNVIRMSFMFSGDETFNQDISGWDVSHVTHMGQMFLNAKTFNANIGDWNVSNVTNTFGMFKGATAFNQDIGGWNVSKVANMGGMFRDASAFSQNIGNWNVPKVQNMTDMLTNSGLSTTDYDSTLVGWAAQTNIPSGISLGSTGLTYCAGDSAHQALIDNHGWTISGDSKDPNCSASSAPPVISNLDGDVDYFTKGALPLRVDTDNDATITDSDSPDFNGGSLTASITSNRQANEDVLGVYVTGAISFGGDGILSFNGDPIGTLTISPGTSDLVVHFTTSYATPAAVQALIRSLSYYNSNKTNPSTLDRTISITVNDGDGHTSEVSNITVFIKGSNHVPVAETDSLNVTENIPATGNVLTNDHDPEGDALTASLVTAPVNGMVVFNADGSFTYTPNTGFSGLDSLIYQVCDNGSPSRCDTAAVFFTVINVNEPPVITSNGGGSTASINVAENATAVTTVTATDADAGTTLTYSLSGGSDQALFTINGTTGALMFNSAPDFENPMDAEQDNRYEVTVQASDGTNSVTQTITVTITDVNESPVITSNGGGSTASINAVENSTAVTTVTATDADAGTTLTYSIAGGADQALFIINGTTGALTFKNAPDFENPMDTEEDNRYEVTVQASDGTNTDQQTITVTVTDIKENAPADAFITTWRTTTAGESITIPINSDVSGYDYIIDWGDGNTSADQTGNAIHTYASPGTYTVSITGNFPAIQFGSSVSDDANDAKLLTIEQWGKQIWQGMNKAFLNCKNLATVSGTDEPLFAAHSDLSQMFKGCVAFNSDLNDWDVSKVRNTSYMFSGADSFNGNISDWDVSADTSMEFMFFDAKDFNGDINQWNVSGVTNMKAMFYGAAAFKSDLSNWNVGNVSNMAFMFCNASSFDKNLSNWNVSKVTNMGSMFYGAAAFSSSLSGWEVSEVADMSTMFKGATSFNCNLGSWNVLNVTEMDAMFDHSGLSTVNYDSTLIGWAAQNVQSDVKLGAIGLTYCKGALARQSLINNHNWTINGDSKAADCGLFILIATPEQDTLILYVFSSDAIQQIEQRINDSTGIPLAQQQLYFSKQKLEDGRTLADYHIQEMDTLDLRLIPLIQPDANGMLYVDSAVAAPGDGSSWNKALPELADALKAAQNLNTISPGTVKQIWVAKGTYLPLYKAADTYQDGTPIGVGGQSFVLVKDVQVYGGFAGTETTLSQRDNTKLFTMHKTTLSGALPGGGHVFHVVISAGDAGDAALNGFVVTGGMAGYNAGLNVNKKVIINGQEVTASNGGGIVNTASSPALNKLIIHHNTASEGGGMYNMDADPVIINVVVHNNIAAVGAGIYNATNSEPLLVNTTIANNNFRGDPTSVGEGIFNSTTANPVIVNSIIYNNRDGRPSGIYGPAQVTYSLVQDWEADLQKHNLDGTQNYDLFVDTVHGNYQLKARTVVIDGGNNDSIDADMATDLAGNARIFDEANGGIVDLGAYEFQGKVDSTKITEQPKDTTVCPAASPLFEVVATGTALTYQWQSSADDGRTWSNLTGETSATLLLSNVPHSDSGRRYRAIVSGTMNADTSSVATLRIHLPARQIEAPRDTTVDWNGTAQFKVVTTGEVTGYQWQSSSDGAVWNNIAGASSATLRLPDVKLADSGMLYRVIVSSPCAAVSTQPAMLHVNPPLLVLKPGTLNYGFAHVPYSVTFTASGGSKPYAYQISNSNLPPALTFVNGLLSGVPPSSGSYTFTVTATDASTDRGAPFSVSRDYTLEIRNAGSCIAVSSWPADQTVCEGDNVSFSVTGTDVDGYQWQSKAIKSGSWRDMAGETNATLTLSNATVTQSGMQYRVVLTSSGCGTLTSNPATLTVNAHATIVKQPENQTVCENDDGRFSVTASGTGLKYQWQSSKEGTIWKDVAHGSTETLDLLNLETAQSGMQYRVVVNGACGKVTSGPATLSVRPQTAIAIQPTDVAVDEGANASLAVTATDATSYQWRSSADGNTWTNVLDGTSATLNLSKVSENRNGTQYTVLVKGHCGVLASDTVTLTVNAKPVITLTPSSLPAAQIGLKYQMKVTANGGNEPYRYQLTGADLPEGLSFNKTTAQFSGTPTEAGIFDITIKATDGDNFSGSLNYQLIVNTPDLTLQPVALPAGFAGVPYLEKLKAGGGTDPFTYTLSSGSLPSGITLAPDGTLSGKTSETGTFEHIKITASDASSGKGAPFSVSNTYTLVIRKSGSCISVSSAPQRQTVCEGGKAVFSISATGAAGYQWQSSTDGNTWKDISGATAGTLALSNVEVSQSKTQYRVVVHSHCGNVTSGPATLTVLAKTAITTQPQDQTVCENRMAMFSVKASGTDLKYQWQSSPDGTAWTDLTGETTSTLAVDSPDPAMNETRFRVIIEGACQNIVSDAAMLAVHPVKRTSLDKTICFGDSYYFDGKNIDQTGTYVDSLRAVTGCDSIVVLHLTVRPEVKTVLNKTICEGQFYRIGNNKYTDPGTYEDTLRSYTGCDSVVLLHLTVNVKTAISEQPKNVTVCPGNDASFTIKAKGKNIQYQWFSSTDGKRWGNIDGATSATLTLSDLKKEQNGTQYKAMLTGACKNDTSDVVTLTVNTPISVQIQPTDKVVCAGDGVKFTVKATGTDIGYQWQSSTDGGVNWNNLSGETAHTLKLSNTQTAVSGIQYRVLISGSCATKISDAVTLTVNPMPTVTIVADSANPVSKGLPIRLTATGADHYHWASGPGIQNGWNSSTVTIRPLKDATYTVTGTTAAGCSVTQPYSVKVIVDYKLICNNIVSPNGDGKNDRWIIQNIAAYPHNEVMIFDRAGRMIYQKKGYHNQWDGTISTIGRKLKEGTYYYVFKVDDGKKIFKGFIELLRTRR